MHGKRRPVKKYVFVPAKWKRDKRGRFVKMLRRKYTRKILDRARWTTGMEMLAENVTRNNTILQRLKER
jgi:hypothetical protein